MHSSEVDDLIEAKPKILQWNTTQHKQTQKFDTNKIET